MGLKSTRIVINGRRNYPTCTFQASAEAAGATEQVHSDATTSGLARRTPLAKVAHSRTFRMSGQLKDIAALQSNAVVPHPYLPVSLAVAPGDHTIVLAASSLSLCRRPVLGRGFDMPRLAGSHVQLI